MPTISPSREDPVYTRIRNAASRNALPHALLFTGPGDRLAAARDFSRDHGCVLVLKGQGTVTAAPDGSACINATGNPGMAKGGSGDVLAGMIAALLGQKHLRQERDNTPELVTAAVCFHGMAGDLCARKFGEYAMLPSDLIDTLPEILRKWTEEES